jgi:SulP family sulfate permease
MASGILAGVDPMYGLYACMIGPIVGGIFASTVLMVVATTSASALVAGQALISLSDGRETALFMMVVLAGVFQILFGLLRLGRFTEFVSYSVMTGFLAGIAVVLILSQLPIVAGYEVTGSNSLAKTIDLIGKLDNLNVTSIALAGLTLVIAVTLQHTRLDKFSGLLAIAIPTVLVALLDLERVQTVEDLANIPRGVPLPGLPSFAPTLEVITGALSVAVIVLAQGAGVTQSVPNPDGTRSNASRDFVAQGAANVVSGFFRGLPVGASAAATALGVASGARRRWAAVFSGLWMALLVVALPGVVSSVAMPALGALLIFAGLRSIKPSEAAAVWRAGWPSRLVIVTTFAFTLLLPIQAAVGLGVLLSAVLFMNQTSTDVSVVQVVDLPDGRMKERKPADRLASDQVTVLDVYGDLFFAGARTLQRMLPVPDGARDPVVILRLRGRTHLGATLIEVLSEYADSLRAVHGRLYITGLGEDAYRHLVHTRGFRRCGPLRAYRATPIVGESMHRALTDAESWLTSHDHDESGSHGGGTNDES